MFLLLAFAVSSIAISIPIQPAQAQATMKTYAISDAIPNPIGLGESTLLKVGISQAAPSASFGWTGITITVVAPDGTTETLGPFTTDSTGSTYTTYTPDQVGTYNLTTNRPAANRSQSTFTDSERGKLSLPAQYCWQATNQATGCNPRTNTIAIPGHSLPTEYWSRPIDPQLREWYSISGNWVARPDNSLALYQDDAPDTAHVLWAQPHTAKAV